ncbi:hypothetical protein MLAC_07940 [Mycobacterium lacus]|uniref:Integrase catalytic domain-containing protein n=2 Tax=Mycobacterium lacus TaxID=169765 RepID=A0A7I7NG27_9MYCO|nr:hypothetical protein MLAC_07940 [Mycobacterium lacus]
MFDLIELYTHWQAGRSQVQLWQSLGMDRKTIRKYLAPAVAEGIGPGGEPLSAEQWAARIAQWFPGLDDRGARASTWPLIDRHSDRIKDWLHADVTVATIAQRLRDDHQVDVSESSVRRWVAMNFADEVARARVSVPRGEVPPGSEAQIDYGRLGMWLNPATAKRVAVWAFVMVLSCSRHLFVRPVVRMDQTTWCTCHVEAFEFFNGIPARLVCDNLKTGVDKPDLYDPKINRTYAELAAHYDCLIDPARAFKPRTNLVSSGRCRMCGIRSGGAASSPRWLRCRARRPGGAGRWPGYDIHGPSTAASRCGCSKRSRPIR